MSNGLLTKEDYENILEAFEAGVPPNLRYLPNTFAGRQTILKGIGSQITKLINSESKIEYAFIMGERGQGKTMTSLTALQYAVSQKIENNLIPIYIDLRKSNNLLEVFRDIYLGILTGALTLIEFNDSYKARLFRLMEVFSIDLNYHKVRPEHSSPPLTLLEELCDVVADLGGIICLIIDELDELSNNLFSSVMDGIMNVLAILNDFRRLSKFWIFCSTTSGHLIFEQKSKEGLAFATRVYQSIKRSETYVLRSLTEQEKIIVTEKVFEAFMGTLGLKTSDLQSVIINSIQKRAIEIPLPRYIIGYTTSMLVIYKEMESLWKKSLQNTMSIGVPIRTGAQIDRIFKLKLLPLFNDLFSSVKFSSNPPEYESTLNPNKNVKSDGVITFPDDFRVFIEIKYTDTRARLNRHDLDQLISPLVKNNNSKGIYLLFGVFDEDPIREEDKQWLMRCDVYDRIESFQITDRRELDSIKGLIATLEVPSTTKELKAACKWILELLGLQKYINELEVNHKGKISDVPQSEQQTTEIIPNLLNREPEIERTKEQELNKRIHQVTIPLNPGLIKNLGSLRVDKIKKALNISTINELVRLNPDEIAKIKGFSARNAKEWIAGGNKLLEGPNLLNL